MYSTNQITDSHDVKHDEILKQQIPNNLVLNEVIFYTKVSYTGGFQNMRVKNFSRENSINFFLHI